MIEHINVGEKPDDGKGEPLRDSLIKTNKNFKHLDQGKLGIDDTAAKAKELETPLKINGQSVDGGGEINIAESDVTKQYVDDGLAEKLDATGTAAKAETLTNPLKINGQSVDGGGDINSFAGSDAGLVPTATTADADKVLSGAGTWVPQSGGSGSGVSKEYVDSQVETRLGKEDNAISSSKWVSLRTFTVSGVAAGVVQFDGSTNFSMVLALNNSGVTAGTTGGPRKSQAVTVNAGGQVTVIKEWDIPVFSGSATGFVPAATAADANKVLSGAGTWVAQSGGSGSSNAETAKKLVKPDGTDLITYRNTSTQNQDVEIYGTRLNFTGRTAEILYSNSSMISFAGDSVLFAKNCVPRYDNGNSLGSSSSKWKDCYLQNAPIVTSDANSKTGIAGIDDAEKACAIDLRKCIKKYKLKSAVAEKGGTARYHFGVIAQEIVTVFEQHGLDAFAYGIVCYSEWEAGSAEVDEEGNIVAEAREAGSAYAIRYEELNMFLFAAL